MNRRQFLTILPVFAAGATDSFGYQRRKRTRAKSPIVAIPGLPHQPARGSLLYMRTRAFSDYDRVVVRKGRLGGSPRAFQAAASGTCTGVCLDEFRSVWSHLLGASAAACWNPGFELAFYRGTDQTLSAQICFDCRLIAFGSLETSAGFDATGETGKRLLSLLDRIVAS